MNRLEVVNEGEGMIRVKIRSEGERDLSVVIAYPDLVALVDGAVDRPGESVENPE